MRNVVRSFFSSSLLVTDIPLLLLLLLLFTFFFLLFLPGRALRISHQWRSTYQRRQSFHVFKRHALQQRLQEKVENRIKKISMERLKIFVERMSEERRYLQRAGRKWRMTSIIFFFQKWRRLLRIKKIFVHFLNEASKKFEQGQLQWAWDVWNGDDDDNAVDEEKEDQKKHHHHGGELCDCLRRFETKRGRKDGGQKRETRGRRRRRRTKGKPLRAFQCSAETHLERRLADARVLVQGTLHLTAIPSLEMLVAEEKEVENINRQRNRRTSTILRKSHWM